VTVTHPTWAKTRPGDEEDVHRGWVFAANGETLTNQNGFGKFTADDIGMDPYHPEVKYVRDLYRGGPPTYSVPILWDTKTDTMVNNESSEIIMMLNSEFEGGPNLFPENLKDAAGKEDSWIYTNIKNGVYRCGFAKTQEAYDQAVKVLFDEGLDRVEAILQDGRQYLLGGEVTLSDVKLFVTLVRFDEVYVVYFKCNKRSIADYPHIMAYMRRLWKMDAFRDTTSMHHIKTHYFTSHAQLNHFAVIPAGPGFIEKLE
jgi:putative glutathione S-transferase